MSEKVKMIDSVTATTDTDNAPLLTGVRQVGTYERPDGSVVVHEVTSDGMKQVYSPGRSSRGYATAAEFYASRGMGVDGSLIGQESGQPARTGRLARAIGKLSRK